jgi:LysM repeat protein
MSTLTAPARHTRRPVPSRAPGARRPSGGARSGARGVAPERPARRYARVAGGAAAAEAPLASALSPLAAPLRLVAPVRPVATAAPVGAPVTVVVAPAPIPLRAPAGCVTRPVGEGPLRLTRRGRLMRTVAALVTLVAAVAGLVALVQPVALPGGSAAAPVVERLTVRPGDTLWAIAQRVAPGTDPRDTVARIEALNHLESSSVPAGVVLRVPVRR